MTPRQKLAAARIKVFDYMPYLAGYVYGLKQKEVHGTGTMGVSKDGTIFWDAEFIEACTVEQLTYALLHEVLHLVYRHHARAKVVYGDEPSQLHALAWNVAADLVIEQTMSMMRPLRPKDGACLGGSIPSMGVHLEFPPNQDAEAYYGLIMRQVVTPPPPPPQPKGGSGKSKSRNPGGDGGGSSPRRKRDQSSDGKEGSRKGQSPTAASSAPGSGGSAGDGVRRPWEEPDESWEAFQEIVAAGTAEQAMRQAELLNPGSVPGNLRQQIAQFLRPQPDPFAALKAAVATSTASPVGGRITTYRRLSRKQPPGIARMRGLISTQPTAVVIIDTSGSMGDRETKERALQVIADGMKKLKNVKVVCADTRIRSSQKLSSISNFMWVGGGGTAMDVALEQVDKEDRPDSIVIVTDAATGWPRRQTRARVVVALTENSSWRRGIPSWCRVVPLFKEKIQ